MTIIGPSISEQLEWNLPQAYGDCRCECHRVLNLCHFAPCCYSSDDICTKPPEGWSCTRKAGHDGPCAAIPTSIKS